MNKMRTFLDLALAVASVAAALLASAAARAATPCIGGTAAGFPCDGIDLLAHLTAAELGDGLNDLWGWTDPLTGVEYALVGLDSGTAFVDLSDPENPALVGTLPSHGPTSDWRDLKVFSDHAFVVSEAEDHGLQVFDLNQLRDVTLPPVTFGETAHYDAFGHAHNLAINEDTAFAYVVGSDLCSGGLHIVDISTPASPTTAGCFSADGFTHDTQCVVYAGPDLAYQGREICLNSNVDTLTLVDVTDKAAPTQISRTGYAGARFAHQGWLTEDHVYFVLGDELDEQTDGVATTTYVWDVTDLDAPTVSATYVAATAATDHNQYVRGGWLYQANYRAGLRVLDLNGIDTGSLSETAFFDTYPADDDPSFNSAWSVYPYFESGIVIVSDIEAGLFVLRPIPVLTELCWGNDATGDQDGDGICDDRDLCLGDNATGDADVDGVCDSLDCRDDDARVSAEVLVLGSETVVGESRLYGACRELRAESGLEIGAGGAVTLLAGETVTLGGGLAAASGAGLEVLIDPAVLPD